MKDKKIGVLMGGLSAEREVSLKSGAAVQAALVSRGYHAVAIDVDRSIADTLRQQHIDAAFIALHGRYGEDGCIQGILELLAIPYTGSGVLASALAMHKRFSKEIFKSAGLCISPYICVSGTDPIPSELPFGYPAVVKPAQEGSSVGISIVKKPSDLVRAVEEARQYDHLVLIEQYIKGREIQVGILNDAAVGAIEIIPKNEFYDFEAKYSEGFAEHVFPAPLTDALSAKVQAEAVKAHTALGCSCYSRVDFLVTEDGDCYLLEVNTLPGMTALSLLPEIACKGAGLSFEDLVEQIIATAALKTGQGL